MFYLRSKIEISRFVFIFFCWWMGLDVKTENCPNKNAVIWRIKSQYLDMLTYNFLVFANSDEFDKSGKCTTFVI